MLFEESTVLDNLIVGHRLRTQSRLWDVIINSRRLRDEEAKCRSRAQEVLDFVGLSHIGHRITADISQEERSGWRLRWRWRPTRNWCCSMNLRAGSTRKKPKTCGLIRKMVDHGVTVCLIEHKMDMIMSLADKIMVLDHGEKIASTPEEVRNVRWSSSLSGSDEDAAAIKSKPVTAASRPWKMSPCQWSRANWWFCWVPTVPQIDLFNTISGLLKPTAGSIALNGTDVTGLKPSALVERVVQCPEGRKLFPEMSVLKNLMLGAYVHRRDKAGMKKTLDQILALFPILDEKKDEAAGSLVVASNKWWLLEPMGRPKLLLLDEPSLGLAPLVVKQMFETIKGINEQGTTLLLAEPMPSPH